MRKKIILNGFICLAIFCVSAVSAGAREKGKARKLVDAAIAALGGESRLREIKSVKVAGIGHLNMLEQSERPEGPYIVSYEQTESLIDLENGKIMQTIESKNSQSAKWSGLTTLIADGVVAAKRGEQFMPYSPAMLSDAEMRIEFGPEKVFLHALESKDLRAETDIIMQGVAHHVVKFTSQNIPVTVFLNANTNLPTAVETVSAHPFDFFWSVWGDVPERTYFSDWRLEAGGLRYPYQWDIQRNNQPLRTLVILTLALNQPIPDGSFKIPENIAASFKKNALRKIDELPLGIPARPAQEIAPGVIKISGYWDMAFVKQKDGIVIIEAPISSGYSVKVLDEAKRRFPGLPVKAVISTADSFPHIGGVREYAARGIPVYALDANRPILERLIAAPHSLYPDALEQKPRKASFKIVSGKTLIGAGENRLEIYPVRSEAGERMLMIYLPDHKLLYAGDLIQKLSSGAFFMPEYLAEVMAAAKRENLTIEKVFAMHSPPVAWSEIESTVAKASAANR